MLCDKVIELPLEERTMIDSSSKPTDMSNGVEYSIRVNPETQRVEYQIPPSKEWVYES